MHKYLVTLANIEQTIEFEKFLLQLKGAKIKKLQEDKSIHGSSHSEKIKTAKKSLSSGQIHNDDILSMQI